MRYDDTLLTSKNRKTLRALSLHLRHNPDQWLLGEDGGISVAECAERLNVFPALIREYVWYEKDHGKGRYSLYSKGHTEMIRATQGHSFPVSHDGFVVIDTIEKYHEYIGANVPLMHGTGLKEYDAIMNDGATLRPMSRTHLHFDTSMDRVTAAIRRHSRGSGRGVIFRFEGSAPLVQDGVTLLLAENGVVLCEDDVVVPHHSPHTTLFID